MSTNKIEVERPHARSLTATVASDDHVMLTVTDELGRGKIGFSTTLTQKGAHELIALLAKAYGEPQPKTPGELTRERFAQIEVGQEFKMVLDDYTHWPNRTYVKIDELRYISPGGEPQSIKDLWMLWKFEVVA